MLCLMRNNCVKNALNEIISGMWNTSSFDTYYVPMSAKDGLGRPLPMKVGLLLLQVSMSITSFMRDIDRT